MQKVAIVGHSQVPQVINVENAEIRIYRAPGGRVGSFDRDQRMNGVLSWEHDLTFLWLGSNDITPETSVGELTGQIKELASEIEERCGSTVIIIEIENREYPAHKLLVEPTQYQRIKRAVNRALVRDKRFFTINFNAIRFTLAPDGVHFVAQARQQIVEKLVENIRQRKGES